MPTRCRSEGDAGLAAGGSVHSDRGAGDFVSEDVEGFSDTISWDGSLGSGLLGLGSGRLSSLLLLLVLLWLRGSSSVNSLGATVVLILAVVISTEGECGGTAWLVVHLD